MSNEPLPTPGTPCPGNESDWLRTAGWFGKIPALGDFVCRRLSPHFIEAWDDWLSAEIVAARQTLGPDWPQSYLQAPIWRFALMPGVIDSRHWYGILAPSVDRVGRQFPLTIAATCEVPAVEPNDWWAALVAVAMRARAPDCDAEALDAVLVGTLECQSARSIPHPREGGARGTAVTAASAGTHWSPWRPESRQFGPVLTFNGLPTGSDFLRLIQPDSG
jgi:type VI secretion system protein ImpM